MSEKAIVTCVLAVMRPKNRATYAPEAELGEIVGGSSWARDIRAKVLARPSVLPTC